MTGSFDWKEAEAHIANVDYPALIKHSAALNGVSLMRISELLGKPANFMSRKIAERSIDLTMLLSLSMHLDVNLFDPLLNCLPKSVRKTEDERQLEAEKVVLEARITELERHLELLKDLLRRN